MQALPQIPGVSLEMYKQRRRLVPEDDGYVGQLWSGWAVILAIVDPEAHPTLGIYRDGSDHYTEQDDWLGCPISALQQQCHDLYLTGRTFADGTRVFGVKIPLRVDERQATNTVHYPENMLMLAQYVRDGGGELTGTVAVWKIALVSQNGEFFLTAQEFYRVCAFEKGKGILCFPRFAAHKQLEQLLVTDAPPSLPRLPLSSFTPDQKPSTNGLRSHQGIVERWYDARNMGCIITSRGPARVHWLEVPQRPRRRFLVAGERVRFVELGQPPSNPKTRWRKLRKARMQLQAFGVVLT